jgi:hypothetical protein
MARAAAGTAGTALAALIALAAACGDGAPRADAAIDAATAHPAPGVPSVSEAADCGGAALVPRTGAPLAVSGLRILLSFEGIDLDGDGRADNRLGMLAGSNAQIAAALQSGALAIPLELFDRGADPDACLKLALYRGACAAAPCDFTDGVPDTVSLDASSIAAGAPISRLRALASAADGTVALAGPGYLELVFPFGDGLGLPVDGFVFPLTTSFAAGGLTPTGASRLRVAGVLQAFRLGQLPAPVIEDLGTSPGDTELDAIFANVLGTVLGLRRGAPGCVRADIDVDGDGLEELCDSDGDDGLRRVDRCIDGGGVELFDGDNGIADCSQAMKHGRPRFVDGISAQLELLAVPAAFTP